MAWGGINVALSALYAQRQALDTVGHNIANANTAGYTRQRVNMVAVSGPVTPAMFANWSGGGAGVSVASIDRNDSTNCSSESSVSASWASSPMRRPTLIA